jgi:hypothetical protein
MLVSLLMLVLMLTSVSAVASIPVDACSGADVSTVACIPVDACSDAIACACCCWHPS